MYTLHIGNIEKYTITFFVFEIVYFFALGMTKISITFMYFRILEGRRWKHVLWLTQLFNVLVMVCFLLALFLSCRPLLGYWAASFDGRSKCTSLWDWNAYYLACSLAIDIWLIAIPSVYVWKTNLAWRNKMSVIAMFCLGLVYVSIPLCLLLPFLLDMLYGSF